MNYKISDLAGKNIEEVGDIIAEAVDLEERKREDRNANTNIITAEVIAIGAQIVYVKDGVPKPGIVRGHTISTIQGGFNPSHGAKDPSKYLIEYPNKCSSYVEMENVFLTREEAAEKIFGVSCGA